MASPLKRDVGLFGAASVGIANIIGAGIFVLSGVAAGLAGPSVILSFLIAGFVAFLTAVSSSELTSFITETGASYSFTKRAFGRFPSFLVGWFVYFDAIVGAAAVSIGFAAYFSVLLGLQTTTTLILAAVGLPLVMLALNFFGIRQAAGAASVMVIIKIFAIVLVIFLGGFFLYSHYDQRHYTPFFANGFGGTLNGAAIIFFAFAGFNTVSMLSEEVRNPQKTIPKALLLAFAITFVLYVGIALVEVGVLDWHKLGSVASPLETLVRALSQNAAIIDFVSFSALIATGSVVLSSITAASRSSLAMARDGMFPKCFVKIHKKYGTPYTSIIICGLVISGLAGIFYNNIGAIASIFNFGTLFTYLFIHLSLIKLRKKEPGATRLFKVPLYPVLPIIGAASCIALMYYLSNTAKMASAIWFLIGLLLYFVLIKRHFGRKDVTLR
ncbi:MAG TPA: amino acid permease [Candidatus Nitrosotalea sp.]|nr:amino acid permease [Candidatus Nitrosotalea sp.]